MVWSLIAQVASRQRNEDVLQGRRVRSQLGEWNMLSRQFSQQSRHSGMKFAHLQQHRAIFYSNVMHALYAAQDRDIERFCRAAGCKFHHLFRAVCRDQFARRAESNRLAMIDNGYTIAKPIRADAASTKKSASRA